MVLRERLQLAGLPTLFVSALVIPVHLPQLPGAGLCIDHRAAVPAEHFTAQQIVHLRPPCRIVAARFEMLGRLLEGGLVNDRLHVQLHVLDVELAQVLLIPQHTIDDRIGDRLPAPAHDPAVGEQLDDVPDLAAGDVELERLPDNCRLALIHDDVALGVYFVTYRQRLAAILALLRRFSHASDDLLTQVGGVILGQAFQHALQDDPLRALRNALPGVHQLDAGPLQGHFSHGNVLAISAEAVDLPHQDAVEAPLLRVAQHPLELVAADDALA
nr:hypothetical protein [Lachnoclostridium sp. An196]